MLYILSLSDIEREELETTHRNHKKPYVRERCKCILLSSEGFSAKNLARLFKVRTRTIYEWIHRYMESGLNGLFIVIGRGLKARLNSLTTLEITTLNAEITQNPQSLRAVSALLSEKFGFEITKSMLKKYLKKN
jgi:transposase